MPASRPTTPAIATPAPTGSAARSTSSTRPAWATWRACARSASTEGLAYGRAAWQVPLGEATVGVAYTHMQHELGHEFSALDASGTSGHRQPVRQLPADLLRNANLLCPGRRRRQFLRDEIGLASQTSDKTIRAATIGLRGGLRTTGSGGGGWNTAYLYWTSGDPRHRKPARTGGRVATARTQGGFGKLQYAVSRLQAVAGRCRSMGRYADRSPPTISTARKRWSSAAPRGARLSGRRGLRRPGYVATVEACWTLDARTRPVSPGQFQLIAFVDAGEVDYAKDPLVPRLQSRPAQRRRPGVNRFGPHDLRRPRRLRPPLQRLDFDPGPDHQGRVPVPDRQAVLRDNDHRRLAPRAYPELDVPMTRPTSRGLLPAAEPPSPPPAVSPGSRGPRADRSGRRDGPGAAAQAQTLPTGGTVAVGGATITTGPGAMLTINQSTQKRRSTGRSFLHRPGRQRRLRPASTGQSAALEPRDRAGRIVDARAA